MEYNSNEWQEQANFRGAYFVFVWGFFWGGTVCLFVYKKGKLFDPSCNLGGGKADIFV